MTLYRFECRDYVDRSEIYLLTFPILRRTPKGCWIDKWGKECFVLLGPTKGRRFAYESKEDAWHSFKVRRMWFRRRMEKTLRHIERVERLMEKGMDEATKDDYLLNYFLPLDFIK